MHYLLVDVLSALAIQALPIPLSEDDNAPQAPGYQGLAAVVKLWCKNKYHSGSVLIEISQSASCQCFLSSPVGTATPRPLHFDCTVTGRPPLACNVTWYILRCSTPFKPPTDGHSCRRKWLTNMATTTCHNRDQCELQSKLDNLPTMHANWISCM